MFQRLKETIDSQIAKEQARQRLPQGPLQRSNSAAKYDSSRPSSPAVRSARAVPDPRQGDAPKGADPAEFEQPEFVIDDDEAMSKSGTLTEDGKGPSRVGTPSQLSKGQDNVGDNALGEEPQPEKPEPTEIGTNALAPAASSELPTDVRVRLRKLERLESRYQELLRSYRIAHARVSVIEPFEAVLRENTPLTSISDPSSFVEYLNQVNLKGDMVLDELKRVSNEKSAMKVKLDEAEKSTRKAWDNVKRLKESKQASQDTSISSGDAAAEKHSEAEDITAETKPHDARQAEAVSKSPPLSARLSGISLFSPKAKAQDAALMNEEPEEFFSYDGEIPRLEKELEKKQGEVTLLQSEARELQGEVTSLKNDLSVVRESTQSMVQTLEEATREVNTLRDKNEEIRTSSESQINELRSELEATDGKLRQLEMKPALEEAETMTDHQRLLSEANAELEKLQRLSAKNDEAEATTVTLREKIQAFEAEVAQLNKDKGTDSKRIETLNKLLADLHERCEKSGAANSRLKMELDTSASLIEELRTQVEGLEQARKASEDVEEDTNADVEVSASQKGGVEPSKKRNKKKKSKSQKAAAEAVAATAPASTPAEATPKDNIAQLQSEVKSLKLTIAEKDAAVERLQTKLREEEEVRERKEYDLESVREELKDFGSEYVTAKDRLKTLETEKAALNTAIEELELEIVDLRSSNTKSGDTTKAHEELSRQFADSKVKAKNLQTDLSVAQQLASSRFKDLTDLRAALHKAQPELLSLRKENGELKDFNKELGARVTELEKIEKRHNILRTEVTSLRKTMVEQESDIRSLNQKVNQESSCRQREEENRDRATRDFERVEGEKHRLSQSLEKTSRDLAGAREDAVSFRSRIQKLDVEVSRLEREGNVLKEEIELKTAQHASAESLMTSMRDQTSEMATQSKEARERCESLEEEIIDAHRLLSERSREAETMRRLLGEVEGRADARVREMKDRMDTAIEERDRAEDEASTAARRRSRDLEEARNKLRDAERNLKRAEDDKEEMEISSRDWRKRREELEQRAEMSGKEAEEVRKAMSALRDALDESERHARDLERQKTELRRTVEDTQQRLDRLHKSNKVMADEVKSMQAKAKMATPPAQSSRSSLDSTPSRARVASPADEASNGAVLSTDYLKTVLLQFLETRDQKIRSQLIPVLGMLLHFDRKDEQKWMAAISAK